MGIYSKNGRVKPLPKSLRLILHPLPEADGRNDRVGAERQRAGGGRMNNKKLKQQRNAAVDAMTESELREYVALLRDNGNRLDAAIIKFLNAGTQWARETAKDGEASEETCQIVVKKFELFIYAFNTGRKLLTRFWDKHVTN